MPELVKKEGKIITVRQDKVPREIYPSDKSLYFKTLFDSKHFGTKDMLFGIAWFEPEGGSCGMHYHDCEEVEYVISGHGVVVEEDGSEQVMEPGVTIFEPAGVPHNFINTGDEPLVVVYAHPSANPQTHNITFGTTWSYKEDF